ncbi:pyridoxamine 5'-phosphate oxidase family protein [Siccirubricoccus sp. G192]|uniref:pyridoxamine 5'-phosphate oxidase family protein n=1 Tax=Siccirubricoccus sp. G192 TaxID=2849651 RepID=UPI0020C35E30|nr:pyridoxamine 5'-phosphate oxidase family protein [Siccirubricoccus sp. G192]
MDTPHFHQGGFEARRLVRAAAAATLATQAAGQPFASLVTPASAPDLSPLLFLSSLSEHTRHLRAEPRCALLFAGAAEGSNPQTAPRVTLTGQAAPVAEAEVAALKARWLARHPYAALYADFADFALWRVQLGGALLVGGFARATRLRLADLLPDPAAMAAIAAAEAGIIAHVNTDHREALAAIAMGLLGQKPGGMATGGGGCGRRRPRFRRDGLPPGLHRAGGRAGRGPGGTGPRRPTLPPRQGRERCRALSGGRRWRSTKGCIAGIMVSLTARAPAP